MTRARLDEYRSYVAEAKALDGALWSETEIRVTAEDLEALLDAAARAEKEAA